MDGLLSFMGSTVGRVVRFVLGLVLIYVGLFVMKGNWVGYIVAIIGLVPIFMSITGRCLLQSVLGSKK
ncbi:MAG: DUF2892 domain-containing protein [Candidatus Promineofilum sp.]|nr:DUF2892 domain-containing protein [Promineifilum sp.]